MPSTDWRALGPGNLLGHLRSDLKRAAREVVIVGPWIDSFFADLVISACPASAAFRVLTRPLDAMSRGFLEHAKAARQRFTDRGKTEIRTLHHLHAKVILIDGAITFCGSANWYRYSLEEAAEIVLRGDGQEVPTLLDELASLWDQATAEKIQVLPPPTLPSTVTSGGYKEEVVDPIAAAKMAEVPGAFVLRRKPPRGR
jgi:phosphatidylserine/phosphatidylglycerophosphate/cardiolipin synthase-like enzyme